MKRSRGFTMIELLATTTIAAGILGGGYGILRAALRSQKITAARAEILQTARVALERLTLDLRSATPLESRREFLGFSRTIGAVQADNLDFATHAWSPRRPGEGDFCEVSWFVDESERTPGLSLWRRRDPTRDDEPLAGGSREEIAPGLQSFHVEYSDGFEWHTAWGDDKRRIDESRRKNQPESEEAEGTENGQNSDEKTRRARYVPTGLPDAVRITLSLAEPAESGDDPPLTFQTVVHLVMARRPVTVAAGSTSEASDGKASTNGAQQDADVGAVAVQQEEGGSE